MILRDLILINEKISRDIYRLVVESDSFQNSKPGQFVQLQIDPEIFTLRRPFGIAGIDENRVEIFYRVVGRGTKFLTNKKSGEGIDLLKPLGNGFNFDSAEKIFLVGGGVGLAPLLFLSRKAVNKKIHVFAGGRTQDDLFWKELFNGEFTGFVSDRFPFDELEKFAHDESPDLICTCAPEIMMRGVARVAKNLKIPCQVSMEKRMACGVGACLGCSIDTIHGRRKICKDGPVFNSEEVFFDE